MTMLECQVSPERRALDLESEVNQRSWVQYSLGGNILLLEYLVLKKSLMPIFPSLPISGVSRKHVLCPLWTNKPYKLTKM